LKKMTEYFYLYHDGLIKFEETMYYVINNMK
jgi:hypothetical protein